MNHMVKYNVVTKIHACENCKVRRTCGLYPYYKFILNKLNAISQKEPGGRILIAIIRKHFRISV